MTEPLIDSRVGFRAALAWAFEQAVAKGAKRVICADEDFAEWPWDAPQTLGALTTWLRLPQRRLELLSRQYETLSRRSPRFTAWRRDWSHALQAWKVPMDWTAPLPTLLVADCAVSVHLIDAVHWRGRCRVDERVAAQWRESLGMVLQRSEPSWAVRTLGL